MILYVIEFYSLLNTPREWRPMTSEVYLDQVVADMMMRGWLKGSPPDTEFRVMPYGPQPTDTPIQG